MLGGFVWGRSRLAFLVLTLIGWIGPLPGVEMGPTEATSAVRVGLGYPEAAAKPPRRKRRSRRARKKAKVAPPAPVEAPPPPALPTRGPTRIDFDDRLIQGQTNQSGAVVLFARKASGLRSMVDRRKSFRERTLRTVFDRRSTP